VGESKLKMGSILTITTFIELLLLIANEIVQTDENEIFPKLEKNEGR
jgi:hypothetical protein